MTKFKESIKKVLNNPKLKEVVEHPATKIAIPVVTTATTAGLTMKRIADEKKRHEEQMEEYEKMEKKLDKLEKEVNKDKKRCILFKKKKDFSIVSGGFDKPEPKVLLNEGIKKVAFDSRLRTPDKVGSEELTNAIKNYPDAVKFNKSAEECYDRNLLCLYQCGDVLLIYARNLYSGSDELYKLNKILETYCRSFDNTDYASTFNGSTAFIELWVAGDTMDYIVSKLVEAGFVLNILV